MGGFGNFEKGFLRVTCSDVSVACSKLFLFMFSKVSMVLSRVLGVFL